MVQVSGWEIEARIKQVVEAGASGQSFCVLCLAERLGQTSAQDYLDIAKALRRVGTYGSAHYETFQGKCLTHTGHSGAGTFWMIRKR